MRAPAAPVGVGDISCSSNGGGEDTGGISGDRCAYEEGR
jgi:hypothetical protein